MRLEVALISGVHDSVPGACQYPWRYPETTYGKCLVLALPGGNLNRKVAQLPPFIQIAPQ
jgi:hypothetical protein